MTDIAARPAHPAAENTWRAGALEAIFAFFLGLILAFVVGVGVTTFDPNPANATREELAVLYSQQEASGKQTPENDTVRDQQIATLERQAYTQEQDWAAGASIIVIAVATLLLIGAVATARFRSVWVFSTGLLLGGLFSMLYGVILSLMAGESTARFFVLLTALAVAAGLGYVRFVRGRAAREEHTREWRSLDARVTDLERRLGTS